MKDYVSPSQALLEFDYWRAAMYAHIERWLQTQTPAGAGVEFGGSNGIIQSFCPQVQWENRDYPEYDILEPVSWDGQWDVVVLDQVLEHVERPWEVFDHLGKATTGLAVVTMPFMLGIHGCPDDFWRMTPEMMARLARPQFPTVHVNSWGNALTAWWLQVYRETSALMKNEPREAWMTALSDSDPATPFVVWGLFHK